MIVCSADQKRPSDSGAKRATSAYFNAVAQRFAKLQEEHTWVKVHLMCGVKTNIVTAVRIGDRHDNDCPEFIPLVNATAGNFTIREVSADKQYLSYENMDAVAAVGGTPYIAFKEGSTGQQGGTFQKMYHTYCLNKDEYFKHYHKRSNVESTYSMIKAKFGDSVRSKTDTAMVNEALCKVLCHNVCCLIQSACELGIEARFWEKSACVPVEIGSLGQYDTELWDWI